MEIDPDAACKASPEHPIAADDDGLDGAKSPAAAASGMTILIVKGDKKSAGDLVRMLEPMGHDVVIADDAASAWGLLQRHRVDLVSSDWMMPGLDGKGLYRRIRETSTRPNTYIVGVTPRDDTGDRLEELVAGADDFLTKPFSRCELVARLGIARRHMAMQEDLERGPAGAGDDRRADRAHESPQVPRRHGFPICSRRAEAGAAPAIGPRADRADGCRFHSSSSTWIASRRTTTPSATRPATWS